MLTETIALKIVAGQMLYSRFLASLLQCAGVADYSTFTVNGAKTALQIASGAIPVLGTVDVTTY